MNWLWVSLLSAVPASTANVACAARCWLQSIVCTRDTARRHRPRQTRQRQQDATGQARPQARAIRCLQRAGKMRTGQRFMYLAGTQCDQLVPQQVFQPFRARGEVVPSCVRRHPVEEQTKLRGDGVHAGAQTMIVVQHQQWHAVPRGEPLHAGDRAHFVAPAVDQQRRHPTPQVQTRG